MPSFGAIKLLQKRTGASRADCKAALEAHDDDEEAAAAALGTVAADGTSIGGGASSSGGGGDGANQAALSQWSAAEQAAGVSIERVVAGDGCTFPALGDTLSMHYRGMLASDGTEFDSSYKRKREFQFKIGIGEVIQGWDVGVMKMSLGEKAILSISSDYGYGTSGNGPIPPSADLKFEVHLTKIDRAYNNNNIDRASQRDSAQN